MRPRCLTLGLVVCLLVASPAAAGFVSNIMLVGFWPPSNEMLRRFSPSAAQNPSGWLGGNWEGRGYNIYSYFPEFTTPPPGDSIGHGDFEVDYQDTSADFWRITGQVHPLAIITFGRGSYNYSWEVEWRFRNLQSWGDDYRTPYQPTPAPPDSSVSAGYTRYSSLPVTNIANAVNAAGLGVSAFVDSSGDAGAFLCEYAGYHATWYQSLHASPSDPYQNFAGGHIHVGAYVSTSQATSATQVTLRSLTTYLNTLIPEPATALLLLGALAAVPRRRRSN